MLIASVFFTFSRQSNSICLRVKRAKSTIFLEASPLDTIADLKSKLMNILTLDYQQQLSDISLLVKKLPLQATQTTQSVVTQPPQSQYVTLEDAGIADHLGLGDDSVLYMVFWIPGETNPEDGKWETVDIPEFEPLIDVVTEPMEEDKKGKGRA
ncbi:hypothetical protein HK096_010126 [Nowakowskiella sp. JEL0078]|nr:hypothetical protein HK096_010126 [Nowakowskiella sp. JEL0078]